MFSNNHISREYWHTDNSLTLARKRTLKSLITEADAHKLNSDVIQIMVFYKLFTVKDTTYYCRRCMEKMAQSVNIPFSENLIKKLVNQHIKHPPHPSRYIAPKVAPFKRVLFYEPNHIVICSCYFNLILINPEALDYNLDLVDFSFEYTTYTAILY